MNQTLTDPPETSPPETRSWPLAPPPSGQDPVSTEPPRAAGPPRRPRRTHARAALTGGLVGALVASGLTFGAVKATDHGIDTSLTSPAAAAPAPTGANPTTPPAASSFDIHALITQVEPSVVAIEIGAKDSSGTVQSVAAGSGVIISDDGLILTNAHVADATDPGGQNVGEPVFAVKMHDGTVREAKVLGTAPDNDVALMRLTDTSNLQPIALGDSGAVQVGDDVVAIGNALDLGDSPTVTKGIISALDRSLPVSDTVTLHGLIQTDAPINHGNSGGALVDTQGRLIGINSAGIPDAQNIGFAIAIDTIKPLLADLTAGRTVHATPTAFLGVTITQTPSGVAVSSVEPGSAADKAGVLEGDILKAVGTSSISTIEQLGTTLRGLTPGTSTTVTVERDGQSKTLQIQLDARPANAGG